jgi:hypothetical protein
MLGFRVADRLHSRADLLLGKDSETEMLIQRPIPRDVPERCQGEGGEVFRVRPAPDLLDQRPPTPWPWWAGVTLTSSMWPALSMTSTRM